MVLFGARLSRVRMVSLVKACPLIYIAWCCANCCGCAMTAALVFYTGTLILAVEGLTVVLKFVTRSCALSAITCTPSTAMRRAAQVSQHLQLERLVRTRTASFILTSAVPNTLPLAASASTSPFLIGDTSPEFTCTPGYSTKVDDFKDTWTDLAGIFAGLSEGQRRQNITI